MVSRRTVNRAAITTAIIALVFLGAGYAFGQDDESTWLYGQNSASDQQYGPEMMGYYGYWGMMGSGMFGSSNGPGMMFRRYDFGAGPARPGFGYGPGQMGNWNRPQLAQQPNAPRIDASRIKRIVNGFLARISSKDLQIAEMVEFQYNYYVRVKDAGSKADAMELLVDPYSGRVWPMPGAGPAWDGRGPAGQGRRWGNPPNAPFAAANTAKLTISESDATKTASDFVKGLSPSYTVAGVAQFPGHYSMFIMDGGKIAGIVSVSGYNGGAWDHRGLGEFIKVVE